MTHTSNIRAYKNIHPTIGENTYIDPAATVIGDTVIGTDSSVWPSTVIRGDVNIIRIGNKTNIQDGSILHNTHAGKYSNGTPLIIGDYVTVGHKVILHGCKIKNFVLVGMGSTVLDNAVIEDEVMLGANSLVTENKTLESGYLYMGAPAKKIRALTPEEKEFLKYSAEKYVQVKDDYLG